MELLGLIGGIAAMHFMGIGVGFSLFMFFLYLVSPNTFRFALFAPICGLVLGLFMWCVAVMFVGSALFSLQIAGVFVVIGWLICMAFALAEAAK